MAHSMDLRLRAVGLLEKGFTVAQISELLDIGTASLWRWKARAKQGRLAPIYPPRPAYKLDEQAMCAYLSEHPDAYQHEIAKAMIAKAMIAKTMIAKTMIAKTMIAKTMIAKAMGVSRTAIQWAFKRLGITRKKRRRVTVSVMKSGAENMSN